jgi:hypothetical protein
LNSHSVNREDSRENGGTWIAEETVALLNTYTLHAHFKQMDQQTLPQTSTRYAQLCLGIVLTLVAVSSSVGRRAYGQNPQTPRQAASVPADFTINPPTAPQAVDSYSRTDMPDQPYQGEEAWTVQCMPDGLIYHSYLAGVKEPRFASVWSDEEDFGSVWDVAIGGRLGIVRWGTSGCDRPDGWQVDMEGAVFPRLDPIAESTPLIACDFRAGIPLTYGCGPLHFKLEYYHISSHLGDEFMLENPDVRRINYSRDTLSFGLGYYWTEALRLYGEIGFAPSAVGGAEPWDVQFGVDFSPPYTPRRGSPFVALNAHLREDVEFNGNFVAQAGWQWRRRPSGGVFRLGLQYFTGKNEQYEFYSDSESRLGYGLWCDY